MLRASHRAVSDPPFDHLGLPYHRSLAADIVALHDDDEAHLAIDLHPTSRVFRRGRRIRVTITGADVDNALTPVIEPPPTITCYRNVGRPSHIVLPVIPHGEVAR